MSKSILLPFVEIETEVPLINLIIGDYLTTAVVDTGAESTVIDKTILKECKCAVLNDVEKSYVGINGKSSEETQLIRINAAAHNDKDNKFHLDGYVSDIGFLNDHFSTWYGYNTPVSIILGSDMLLKYNANIDFENKVIEFKK